MPEGRLPPPFGAWIDRSRPIRFRFDGRTCEGYAGDTIASALMANGVFTLSRSFKYHRPRGVLSLAGLEANTLVTVGGEPNVFADRYPITEGLEVRSQNTFGSLAFDLGRVVEAVGRFLPPGFYYRAFFRPRWAWPLWEPVIRRLAGLGTLDPRAEVEHGEKIYLHADVAVVGGGAAGLSAALTAAEAGATVALVEEAPLLGGALAYARIDVEETGMPRFAADLIARVEAHPRIRVLKNATTTGVFADNWVAVVQGDCLFKLRAKAIVVATGAVEQLPPFRHNDRPGILFAGAAQRLVRGYGVRLGDHAVVVTAHDGGYGAALDLLDADIAVAAVCDMRPSPPVSPLAEAAAARGIPVITGARPFSTRSGRRGRVAALTVRTPEGTITLAADLVVLAAGWQPAAALLCHAGARLSYDPVTHWMRVQDIPAGIFAAGAVMGQMAADDAMADGRRAGAAAASVAAGRKVDHTATASLTVANPPLPEPDDASMRGKAFVDLDEDLSVADLAETVALGYDHPELAKRYSTVGMGPSQGRHSGIAAARVVRALRGEAGPSAPTTLRPPYRPEKFSVLAGPPFAPERVTPLHDRHLEAGATMMNAGTWKRPAFYGSPSESEAAIRREVLAVRRGVGLIDVSTLGGFEIRGPDAALFLERIYTGAFKGQKVGMGRYVLATDLAGAIIDDGIAARLSDTHFYVTASTGATERMHRQFLWWNAQWRLDVDIANVTAGFAAMNLAGPRSREVLAVLTRDLDLAPDAFPYMGVRVGYVAGIKCRILRVGFVGELGYEIHCPAGEAEFLWDSLVEAGRAAGLRLFGVEAQRVLRLEKGHIIIGQDTDGLADPHEAGMGWAVADKKPFFVGQRAIRIRNREGQRAKLVGFTIDSARDQPEEGCLVLRGGEIAGRVTSVALSPTLDRVIGLAYVPRDQATTGTRLSIRRADGRMVAATVAPTPFYDPDNARQKA